MLLEYVPTRPHYLVPQDAAAAAVPLQAIVQRAAQADRQAEIPCLTIQGTSAASKSGVSPVHHVSDRLARAAEARDQSPREPPRLPGVLRTAPPSRRCVRGCRMAARVPPTSVRIFGPGSPRTNRSTRRWRTTSHYPADREPTPPPRSCFPLPVGRPPLTPSRARHRRPSTRAREPGRPGSGPESPRPRTRRPATHPRESAGGRTRGRRRYFPRGRRQWS
ncbi:hypothetical protein PX52LOC_07994 [Limnoglobus roseus]|uniref:Uncharacterized protein n=1 Tax=Limnoglobus roseus TaxID=2598579 RepID=A0A5C1AS04_9BACT|nr:hypothetical protein PX52LOC_07994 [Limnoglobus roseus]